MDFMFNIVNTEEVFYYILRKNKTFQLHFQFLNKLKLHGANPVKAVDEGPLA